jgi:hypothetical protein
MSLTMSFPGKLCAAGAFLLVASAAFANENYAVTGNAYNVNNNLLVYSEYYTDMNHNREVTVNYTKPDGNIFATKTLFYTGEVTQPEFELHDKRDDEKVSARFVDGRLVLSHSLNYSTNEKTIMNNASMVIDAGFDAFIQQNWGKLTTGKKVNFMFALPTRVDTVRLQVREVATDKTPLAANDNPADWRYFVITPANRFASIFADPIYLAYSPEKYLMRYQGRSNLDDDKGGAWDVRIEYQYR